MNKHKQINVILAPIFDGELYDLFTDPFFKDVDFLLYSHIYDIMGAHIDFTRFRRYFIEQGDLK